MVMGNSFNESVAQNFRLFQKQMAIILSIQTSSSIYAATKAIHSAYHPMLKYIAEVAHRHYKGYTNNIVRTRDLFPEYTNSFDMEIRTMIIGFTGLLLLKNHDDARVHTYLYN